MVMECKIFAVKDIRDNSKIVERMFSLMKKHYENMKKDKFLKDLYDKSNVFLLFENNEIKGFSTIKKINVELKNENNEKISRSNINWYPGHMFKTKREIIEILRKY